VQDEENVSLLQKITLISPDKRALELAEETLAICDGVYYARDLINGNADEVTPEYFGLCAHGLDKQFPIKTTVFDKKRIEKEGLELLLAVNRGSDLDPAFIIMEYKGKPKSSDNTILIGKGITYDTGGLNLKPTGGMETMKCDMSGAAACFGAILAVCNLGLKVNLTVVVPTTENGIDAKSFKPGDVYRSYLGKTVEMMNSDAEGRLVLADALAYACQKLKPSRIIDMATLTGAIEVALGSEASGIMSTDDKLAEGLILAGERTYERLWRMPLYEEYNEKLKSDIADLKSWNGRSASSCVAAMFLKTFVEDSIPWAHIDIAGTAYLSEGKKYQPKYAIGVGVRLIVEYLKDLSASKS
jgi:leucyl aminopeptidase